MNTPKITNEEEALAAVREHGLALEYVPENLKTAKVCLEAVKQEGCALYFVPESLKTQALCLEAVKRHGWALKYVPWGQLKPTVPAMEELCLEGMKQDPFALQVVPPELKTTEVCLAAVLKFGSEFTIVPKTGKRVTKKMRLETQKMMYEAHLRFVPEVLRDEVRRRLKGIND